MPAHQLHRGERLERRHVAAARHDDIGFATLIVAGPLPDADSRGAVLDGLIHRQPLQRRLLAGDDDVHAIARAQAMVGDPQQRVRIRRQIHADHIRLLVHDVVDEAGILMTESVVVLPPDVELKR